MADYAAITGWGKCLPPAILTNDQIASVIDTSDEWIRSRSGICERRVSHVPGSDLATVAGQRALAAADATRDERAKRQEFHSFVSSRIALESTHSFIFLPRPPSLVEARSNLVRSSFSLGLEF